MYSISPVDCAINILSAAVAVAASTVPRKVLPVTPKTPGRLTLVVVFEPEVVILVPSVLADQ